MLPDSRLRRAAVDWARELLGQEQVRLPRNPRTRGLVIVVVIGWAATALGLLVFPVVSGKRPTSPGPPSSWGWSSACGCPAPPRAATHRRAQRRALDRSGRLIPDRRELGGGSAPVSSPEHARAAMRSGLPRGRQVRSVRTTELAAPVVLQAPPVDDAGGRATGPGRDTCRGVTPRVAPGRPIASAAGGQGTQLVGGLDCRGCGEQSLEGTLIAQVRADPATFGEHGSQAGHDGSFRGQAAAGAGALGRGLATA